MQINLSRNECALLFVMLPTRPDYPVVCSTLWFKLCHITDNYVDLTTFEVLMVFIDSSNVSVYIPSCLMVDFDKFVYIYFFNR
jgi:hypothetical protein